MASGNEARLVARLRGRPAACDAIAHRLSSGQRTIQTPDLLEKSSFPALEFPQ
jgi:hypothetical protein